MRYSISSLGQTFSSCTMQPWALVAVCFVMLSGISGLLGTEEPY